MAYWNNPPTPCGKMPSNFVLMVTLGRVDHAPKGLNHPLGGYLHNDVPLCPALECEQCEGVKELECLSRCLQETDRELILRFFAMAGHMPEYKMPLSNFLNDEADRGISLDEGQLQGRRGLFKKALHNASPVMQSCQRGLPCVCLTVH